MASAGVAREDQELRVGDIMHFRLACDFSGRQDGKLHGVLGFEGGLLGADAVLEKPGVAALGAGFAAVLDGGALEHGVEVLAVGAGGEGFQALVVATAGGGVFGFGFEGRVVDGWGGGVEAVGAVAEGDEGVRGADGFDHFTFFVELVDVGGVFVADPVGRVVAED